MRHGATAVEEHFLVSAWVAMPLWRLVPRNFEVLSEMIWCFGRRVLQLRPPNKMSVHLIQPSIDEWVLDIPYLQAATIRGETAQFTWHYLSQSL